MRGTCGARARSRARADVPPALTRRIRRRARAQGRCRFLGIARPVSVLSSDEVELPLTWGVLCALAWSCLATRRTGSAERLRRYALQHELAHVKRFDARTQLVAGLASALFGLHPRPARGQSDAPRRNARVTTTSWRTGPSHPNMPAIREHGRNGTDTSGGHPRVGHGARRSQFKDACSRCSIPNWTAPPCRRTTSRWRSFSRSWSSSLPRRCEARKGRQSLKRRVPRPIRSNPTTTPPPPNRGPRSCGCLSPTLRPPMKPSQTTDLFETHLTVATPVTITSTPSNSKRSGRRARSAETAPTRLARTATSRSMPTSRRSTRYPTAAKLTSRPASAATSRIFSRDNRQAASRSTSTGTARQRISRRPAERGSPRSF